MRPMPEETDVRASYDEVASVYTELFADVARAHPLDRSVVSGFADQVAASGGGLVADLGCGPGHWAAYLHGRGLDVVGIDLSRVFVDTARRRYPRVRFEEGTMTALDLPDGSLAGALSWYSTIHAPLPALRLMLAEIGRVLAPGGTLLLGFQTVDADDEEPFDHRVVTAYQRPLDLVSRLLDAAGLVETARVLRRPEAGERCPAGVLLARRS